MIAKAKSISHGIRAVLYVSGESRNKKHPEKITRICDNFMPQGMDASGIWTEMKFATMDRPDIKNNVIRMEISPAMEHTGDFTVKDWQQLWRDLAAAFDNQEILNEDGEVISVLTNISGSKSSVWLHREAKSGIPHLHAVVCRIDENGNINNDHAIHIRAHRAAEQVARQRGWITAKHIHESRIPQVSEDCMEALRELDEWSWKGYAEKLSARGYELYLRKDDEGIIRGYVLHKGSSRFKGSELGKGRNLTASRIERTWEKLHAEEVKQTKQESPIPKRPVVTAPKPSAHTEAGEKAQVNVKRNIPVNEDYTEWQPDRLHTKFEHGGKTYERYIPEKVLDCLNDEFDHRDLANWQALQNLTIAFFTLVASPYGEVSGGGGGGSQSDLKWGRDPEEDEIEFARRCARETSHRLGLQKKSGMKRK